MKKRRIVTWALIVICLAGYAAPVAHGNQEQDKDQEVILSWTTDNAHSQTIGWSSRTKEAGYIQYREQGRRFANEQQVKAKVATIKKKKYYRYEGTIKGLHQNTLYEYRIGNGKSWGEIRQFATAPMVKDPLIKTSNETKNFDFMYLGDIQYKDRKKDYQVWSEFAQKAYGREPKVKFAILGGDMVNYPNSLKEWRLFLKNASPVFSKIPMMTTVGNHETSQKNNTYCNLMALPENGPKGEKETFFSFDYGDCHIVSLNTNFFLEETKKSLGSKWETKRELINGWLEDDLANSDASWKIVFMHHPAYGISDGSAVYEQIRKEWVPKFQDGGVDLVFCGHQHIYMRSEEIDGITYIMGNSGEKRSTYYNGENFPEYGKALDATNSNYQIIRVRENKLSVTSYDDEGQIIDKWSKKSSPFSLGEKAAMIGAAILLGIAIILGRIFWFRKDI